MIFILLFLLLVFFEFTKHYFNNFEDLLLKNHEKYIHNVTYKPIIQTAVFENDNIKQ